MARYGETRYKYKIDFDILQILISLHTLICKHIIRTHASKHFDIDSCINTIPHIIIATNTLYYYCYIGLYRSEQHLALVMLHLRREKRWRVVYGLYKRVLYYGLKYNSYLGRFHSCMYACMFMPCTFSVFRLYLHIVVSSTYLLHIRYTCVQHRHYTYATFTCTLYMLYSSKIL